MATPTWPAFLSSDGSPEVTAQSRTLTSESQGGTRFSVSLWHGRRKYMFRYFVRSDVAAPSPLQTMSELEAVFYLVDELAGSFGQVYVTDPVTGSAVLCRLLEDEVTAQQDQSAPWWKVEVSFVSELGG